MHHEKYQTGKWAIKKTELHPGSYSPHERLLCIESMSRYKYKGHYDIAKFDTRADAQNKIDNYLIHCTCPDVACYHPVKLPYECDSRSNAKIHGDREKLLRTLASRQRNLLNINDYRLD